MPAKMSMVIQNGNNFQFYKSAITTPTNSASLGSTSGFQMPTSSAAVTVLKSATAQMPLNKNMIGRIHNVRPGCGSCGRH